MRLLEVVRGTKTAQGRARHHHEARQDAQEGAGGLGRVRRLHRQPHAGELRPAEPVPARRGRQPAAGGRGAAKWGMAMGPFAMCDMAGNDIGWDIRKRRYRRAARLRLLEDRRQDLRAGPLRPEDRQGLLQVRSRATASRSRIPRSTKIIRRLPEGEQHQAPRRSPTRRSSSAASTRWSTRARTSSRKASRCAPPTSTWSTSPATASRPTAAGRCSTPTRSGLQEVLAVDRGFQKGYQGDSLEAGAAARQTRQRRKEIQWIARNMRPSSFPPRARRSARAGAARST